jgi:hypothetical protein
MELAAPAAVACGVGREGRNAAAILSVEVLGRFLNAWMLARGNPLSRRNELVSFLAPLSGIAMVGITPEEAGTASGLFNMLRNLGGAIGVAMVETFTTKREQYHSFVINSHVSVFEPATRQRLGELQQHFMTHGSADHDSAHQAVVAVGKIIRSQATLMGICRRFRPGWSGPRCCCDVGRTTQEGFGRSRSRALSGGRSPWALGTILERETIWYVSNCRGLVPERSALATAAPTEKKLSGGLAKPSPVSKTMRRQAIRKLRH